MKSLSIHIVEDQAIIAMDMEDILNELGHSVENISTSYEEVISKLPSDQSDLFLIDIMIKGSRSGIEIAEELREREIPHVFVSSQLDRKVLEKASQTSPVGFIGKPFNLGDVSSALNEVSRVKI